MANPTSPFGFRPVRHLNGAPFSEPPQLCFIPASDGNKYFIGDLVSLAGNADSTYGCTTVSLCSVGGVPLGVVVGFDPVIGGVNQAITPNLNITYRPASTAQYVYVVTDPTAVFEVMANGSLTSSAVGDNINITQGSGGSTSTGVSSFQIDTTTLNTTNTLQFHIIGKSTLPNIAFGTNVIMEVCYNLHAYGFSTAGV